MAAVATESGTHTALRTFVAIDLPDAVKVDLAARQEALRAYLRSRDVAVGLRWSDPRGVHLTLRFLGETTQTQCAAVADRLHHLAARWSPLRLRIDALGMFPSPSQPRVLWLGLAGEVARLAALQAEIEAAVQAAGFVAEPKAFAPHITLARLRREAGRAESAAVGRALAGYRQPVNLGEGPIWCADHLVHYHSDLQPGGAVYTPLAVVPLATLA